MFPRHQPRILPLPGLILLACLLAGGASTISAQGTAPAAVSPQEHALRRAAKAVPANPQAMAQLADFLIQQNQPEEAATWLEKSLKLRPDATTRRTLATVYWQLGQLEKARANFDLVLQAKPQDEWASLLLGMVEADLGHAERAAQLLTAVPARVRQRPEPILALARAQYQLKQQESARQALQLLQPFAQDRNSIFAAGRLAAEFRDYDTAQAIFGSMQDGAADTQFNLALAQFGARRYAECEKTLRESVDSGKAGANAYELLGWTLQKQDKLPEMMKAFEKAINLEPGVQTHFLELGQALLEKRTPETALDVADEAVKRFPGSSQAWSLKGAAELRMSRLTEALQSYGKAVELDPNDPKAALGLALTYWNANQDAKAEQIFAAAAAKFPQSALIQLKYAIFLLNAPDAPTPARQAQIKQLLERSEQLDDTIAETHFNLGNLAVREERYPDALREFTAAAQQDPELAKVHFALARVYRRLGRSEDAARETAIHQALKAKEEAASDLNAGTATRHP